MLRRLRHLFDRLARLGSSAKPPVDRSTLVGMYLNQANRPTGLSARGAETHERKNGRFAQNRRRGSSLSS